jgi:hypothetical protein
VLFISEQTELPTESVEISKADRPDAEQNPKGNKERESKGPQTALKLYQDKTVHRD